jgi:hypothetical protein
MPIKNGVRFENIKYIPWVSFYITSTDSKDNSNYQDLNVIAGEQLWKSLNESKIVKIG